MEPDVVSSSPALHDVLIRAAWCVDCCKWHFRLSLRLRQERSSRQWETISSRGWDHEPEMDEHFRMLPGFVDAGIRDLMRLEAEHEAGVTRLF